MISRQELFRAIFSELPFPYPAIDLWVLADLPGDREPCSHFLCGLFPDNPKNDAFLGAMLGILTTIEPPPWFLDLLSYSQIVQYLKPNIKSVKDFFESPQNHFLVQEKGDQIVWEELSWWPLAYSTFLSQITDLINIYRLIGIERREELSRDLPDSVAIFTAEFPRNLPTSYHYAAASLGLWLGGAENMQYFSYYATQPQIASSDRNIEYGERIGYDEQTLKELDSSGIICIPSTLMWPLSQAQGSKMSVFGTISVDESNVANLPTKRFFQEKATMADESVLPGFILDKYYRAPFYARPLEDYAIYGEKNILRDHYTDFYGSIGSQDLMRGKHYCFPIIDIKSIDEANKIITRIPNRGSGGLFFRGQTSFFELRRTDGVKRLLFGDSNSFEPSLTTSAGRINFDYDKAHYALRYFLGQNRIFGNYDDSIERDREMTKWKDACTDVGCSLDFAIMALSQHYGLPSNGLDVTTDLDVAFWFATNKFSNNRGISKYNTLNPVEWSTNKKEWPVVFVFQTILNTSMPSLMDCVTLENFGIHALRPELQSAKFFHGGHSDHQNRLAESLICAFRLHPGRYPTNASFEELFPSPREDSAYSFMIEFAQTAPFSALAENYVNVFHQ